MAKWEWVRDRVRFRAGARECNTSFFVVVVIGASLSEPHTSGTAMHNACVCMSTSMTTRHALLKLEKGSYDDMASGGNKCQQEDSRGKESGRRKR